MERNVVNLISEGTRLEGRIELDQLSRVCGTLVGEIHVGPGASLILSETAVVEGDIYAESVLVDGFVQGNIHCTGKVKVSRTGRVVGNIAARTLELEFGAFFEGRCRTECRSGSSSGENTSAKASDPAATVTSNAR